MNRSLIWLLAVTTQVVAPGLTACSERLTENPTQSAPAEQEPIRVGVASASLKKVKHVDPVYPPEAAATGLGGIVVVEVRIGVDGRVEVARVVRSIPPLDQAALDAVRQWQFEPLMFHGAPTAFYRTVTVNFAAKR